MAAPVYYSAEMVRAFPEDGNRYETVHGELLVTPSPRRRHQRVVRDLMVALDHYVAEHGCGEVLSSPADISGSPDVLVQPDLFVVSPLESQADDWPEIQRLALVIEVLSPSTARYDRFTKRRLYQEVGIPAYWIVDPEARAIEVWTPTDTAPRIERERVTWFPAGASTPLQLDIQALFRPI